MTIIPPPPFPQVVIQFEGICVNFSRVSFPFLPTAHRIVLINASTITSVWGNPIEPHLAGFSTGLNSTEEFPLSGAVLQIANPITTGPQTGVTYIPPGQPGSYFDIPSLTLLTAGLSPASLAVLTGHNPELTACYFDIDYGTIGSTLSQFNAIMTVVTVLTDGDPQYQLKPFPSALSSTILPLLAPQQATNNMSVWNEEQSILNASNNDFLLSYLVLSQPPASTPNLPQSPGSGSTPNRKAAIVRRNMQPGVPIQDLFTDVGCSNSNYP